MAITSYHAPTQRWLTTGYGWKSGDVVEITFGSYAYDTAPGGFGFMGCESTIYTLTDPIAHNERGEPLFDLDQCDPRCPIDNSPQLHEGRRHPSQGAWTRPDGKTAFDMRQAA